MRSSTRARIVDQSCPRSSRFFFGQCVLTQPGRKNFARLGRMARIKSNGKNRKTYESILLRESVRKGTKVTSQTLAILTKLPAWLIDTIEAAIAKHSESSTEAIPKTNQSLLPKPSRALQIIAGSASPSPKRRVSEPFDPGKSSSQNNDVRRLHFKKCIWEKAGNFASGAGFFHR